MPVAIKNEPILLRPNGSHWLTLENGPRRNAEPFNSEELYPIVELDVPRVGLVRAKFSASRYVASDATRGAVWTDWHVILRDVDLPDPERPDLPHLGKPAPGVGPTTRKAISAAGEPLIRAWLETQEYRRERRKAAAYAMRRELQDPRALSGARKTLRLVAPHLGPMELSYLSEALHLLEEAAAYLEREPMAD